MYRSYLRLGSRCRCFSGSSTKSGGGGGGAKNSGKEKKSMMDIKKLDTNQYTLLSRNSNQAQGLAEYSKNFMNGKLGKGPDKKVYDRCEMFHIDSVLCGISALALQCNAPTVLQKEALEYKEEQEKGGVELFGNHNNIRVKSEKAIVANCSAVREWDSNGTVFGYNDKLGSSFQAGEFGHNDYYPVIIAACQMKGLNGQTALKAMVLHDEIRGRLAEIFSLKTYKIDHVVHGAIATAIVYGTLLDASIEEIESAIGMTIAHYIPFRAIRAGHQLSDSKGASAAISSEMAVLSVHRSMRGFIGPKDIFRNPQAIFKLFEPNDNDNESPFDLILTHTGNDFSIMNMHFKLGLYEHQSAGAIQSLLDALQQYPEISKNINDLKQISIKIYEPAFSIIGDPHKKNPTTRQSADHSMLYIIASILNKAYKLGYSNILNIKNNNNDMWKYLMLLPYDYSNNSLFDQNTRNIMNKIIFQHGGIEYDQKYPQGIPTSLNIQTKHSNFSSDLVMFPAGHSKNTTADLKDILNYKWKQLAKISFGDHLSDSDLQSHIQHFSDLRNTSAQQLQHIYNLPYVLRSWDN